MTLQRITVDVEIDGKLRYLSGRVGLKANLLCRLGLCLSFEEPGLPDGRLYREEGDGGREFNRYTLLGEYDAFFMALLQERLILDGLDPHTETALEDQFLAHLGRGVVMLSSRLKGLADLADLVTTAMDRCLKHLGPADIPTTYCSSRMFPHLRQRMGIRILLIRRRPSNLHESRPADTQPFGNAHLKKSRDRPPGEKRETRKDEEDYEPR